MKRANRARLVECFALTGYTFSLFLAGASLIACLLADRLQGISFNVVFTTSLAGLTLAVNALLWRADAFRAELCDIIARG